MSKPTTTFEAIKVPFDGAPELVTIERANALRYWQEFVGGYVESVATDFSDVSFICHEEAKFRSDWQETINRAATQVWYTLRPSARGHDVLAGNVLVIGPADANGETQSVPERAKIMFGVDK